MRKIFKSLLLAGLVAIGTTAASATILVDDFSAPPGGQCVDVGAINSCNDDPEPVGFESKELGGLAGVLGGVRYLKVDVTPTSGFGAANFAPLGQFSLNIAALGSGSGTLCYDGSIAPNDSGAAACTGLSLGTSIVGLTGIGFDLLATDLDGLWQFTLCDTGGNCISNTPVAFAVPGAQFVPFAGFTPNPAFDPANVGRMQLQISSTSSIDIVIDNLVLTEGVPEPGTYALMGAGLLALAALRRRRA